MSELQRDSLVGVVCLVPGLGGGGVQEGRSLPVGLQQGEDEETADGLVCVNGGGGGGLVPGMGQHLERFVGGGRYYLFLCVCTDGGRV